MSENEKMQMLKKWKKQYLNEDNKRKQKIRNETCFQNNKKHIQCDKNVRIRLNGFADIQF